jgi:hypothetical protein
VQRLVLKLYTNDLHTPVCKVMFLDHSTGLKTSDQRVIEAAARMEEWYALFLTVLRGQQAETGPSSPQEPQFGRRRSLLAGN